MGAQGRKREGVIISAAEAEVIKVKVVPEFEGLGAMADRLEKVSGHAG